MIQCGNGLGLALETFAELRGGNFDSDVATQAWVMRAVDRSHAAFANWLDNFIVSESVAGRQWHGRVQFSLLDREANSARKTAQG
jgi:hypothetical protein